MGIKKYEFCAEEMIILREALAEYKHAMRPNENASENRRYNYRMITALLEQFTNDVRAMK